MKIEIGSGKTPQFGYTHIDIESSAKPDILGDFRTLHFENLEEIRAYHVLEHFGREEAVRVLKLWHSWLAPNGILKLETPNFEEICRRFPEDKNWLCRHAYGSQEAEWAFHKDGWWREKFECILPEIGFEIFLIKGNKSRVFLEGKTEKHVLPNITVFARKK